MAPHPNLTKRSSRGTRPGRQGASGVLPCGGQCRPLLCRINCQVAARCNHDCHLRSGLGGCRWAGVSCMGPYQGQPESEWRELYQRNGLARYTQAPADSVPCAAGPGQHPQEASSQHAGRPLLH